MRSSDARFRRFFICSSCAKSFLRKIEWKTVLRMSLNSFTLKMCLIWIIFMDVPAMGLKPMKAMSSK